MFLITPSCFLYQQLSFSLFSMVHAGHGGYTRSQVKSPGVCSVYWWTRGRRMQSQTQRPRCMLAMEDTQGAKYRALKKIQHLLFTGEVIFPWMFDEIHALKPFKAAAFLLASQGGGFCLSII